VLQGREAEHLEPESHLVGIHDCAVSADRAGGLQLADAALTPGHTQVHPGRQVRQADPTLILQHSKNFSIGRIHEQDSIGPAAIDGK